MKAYWERLQDTLDRLTADAQAPVRNVIERVTNGGQEPLESILTPLVPEEGGPIGDAVKKLTKEKPKEVETVIAILSGKDSSAIRPEDCGYVEGLLKLAGEIRPKAEELKLMWSGRSLSLPPVRDDRGRTELVQALKALREGQGLPAEHVARLVLDLLFPTGTGEDGTADAGKADQ